MSRADGVVFTVGNKLRESDWQARSRVADVRVARRAPAMGPPGAAAGPGARPGPPFVEARKGELGLDRRWHEGGEDRQDQITALSRSPRIEDDDALALRYGTLHHRQVHRASGRGRIVQRDLQRA